MYAFGRVIRDAGIVIYKDVGNDVKNTPKTKEYKFISDITSV